MKNIFISKELFKSGKEYSYGIINFILFAKKNNYNVITQHDNSFLKVVNHTLQYENIQLNIDEDSNHEIVLSGSEEKILLNGQSSYNNFNEVSDELLFKLNRIAETKRTTNETDIFIKVNLDGTGKSDISTGIGFFDHMLEQIARHGNTDLTIQVIGDLHVDYHHTVEDTGIALGTVILKALGSKAGIKRYGHFIPMDEAIAKCTIDIGGRSYLNFKTKFKRESVGQFPTELTKEFFKGLSMGLNANIYLRSKGENDHHKIEALFKVFAKALNEACRIDERTHNLIPSTKGML